MLAVQLRAGRASPVRSLLYYTTLHYTIYYLFFWTLTSLSGIQAVQLRARSRAAGLVSLVLHSFQLLGTLRIAASSLRFEVRSQPPEMVPMLHADCTQIAPRLRPDCGHTCNALSARSSYSARPALRLVVRREDASPAQHSTASTAPHSQHSQRTRTRTSQRLGTLRTGASSR